MKRKLLYFLMVAMFAIVLPSCGGDDDEPDAKIKVTQSEIQGDWKCHAYGTTHSMTFNGNNYSYSRSDNSSIVPKYMENGTYTISGTSITFKARLVESELGTCEIYWDDPAKTILHIYPIGSYSKTK